MDNEVIDKAFEEGQIVKNYLYNLQGENSRRTIERFSYKFLEGLRRKDNGDLTSNLIRLYSNLEQRRIPEFFRELLKDAGSMNQIGYAFLLGLNSYKENSERSSVQDISEDIQEDNESIENDEEE